MTDDAPKKHPLVDALERLSEEDNDHVRRAELARLRAYWRPGHELELLPFVLSFLPPPRGNDGATLSDVERRRRQERDEDDALLLAGLFALHPESGPLTLAKALREVSNGTGSDSVEGRFRVLLSADRAELGTHLRHAVSLVAAKGLSIDWGDLHSAIRRWGRDDTKGSVRRRWAREFWASAQEAEAPPAQSPAEPAGSASR